MFVHSANNDLVNIYVKDTDTIEVMKKRIEVQLNESMKIEEDEVVEKSEQNEETEETELNYY